MHTRPPSRLITLRPPSQYRRYREVPAGCLAVQSARGRRSLDLAQTAVHEEFTAGGVTTFVGGEKRDSLGDLFRGSRSAQRNGRSNGLDIVVLLLFRHPKACLIA